MIQYGEKAFTEEHKITAKFEIKTFQKLTVC